MPDPADFTQGNKVSLVVAHCDNSSCTGGHQLNAAISVVRIFIRKTSFDKNNGFSFTLSDGKGSTSCGSQDDISATNNTNFSMSTLRYIGDDSLPDPWADKASVSIGPGGSNVLTSGQAGCGNYPIIVRANQHGNVGTGQYDGWYGFEFHANMTVGSGWNSFKLSASNAFFSYYAGAGDHFAVKAAPNTGSGNFAFPFAPNCSAGLQTQKDLHWYDADAGLANQLYQNPVKTTLWGVNEAKWLQTGTVEETSINLNIYANASDNPVNKGGHTDWDSYQWGNGGNKQGGWFHVTLKTGWIYAWTWYSVYSNNGVQFSLPYDSFNAYAGLALSGDCWTASCIATPAQANLPLGSGTTIAVRLTNTSTTGLHFPASFELRQTNPGNAAQNAGNISAGDTKTLTYNIQPRGSPISQEFDYTLYSNSGSAGDPVGDIPLCKTNITWGAGGGVTVTCVGTPTVPDVEPGQTGKFSYVVKIVNSGSSTATVTFGASGSGGVTGVSATNPASLQVPANTTIQTDNPAITATAEVDYAGQFNGTATVGGTTVTCSAPVSTSTRPYFVVKGGDLSTGGGFKDINDFCGSGGGPPFIAPSTSGGNADAGGILAFSSPSLRGSSADFGVDALGEIYKNPDPTKYMGFYSGANALFASANKQTLSTSYGGFLNADQGSKAYCVQDFYDKTKGSNVIPLTLPPSNKLDFSSLGSQQYEVIGNPTITHGPWTIGEGIRPTLYVTGNLTIDTDITNQLTWNPTDPLDVPFLTIVVRGNIYLTSNVTQVDGLFIAQPKQEGGGSYDAGQFNTCDSFCTGKLTVNGAVIAQQINLLREHGTLCGSGACNTPSYITTEPAEVFNYTPAMVMGKPNFKQNQSLSGVFESLISLPPVF